MTVYLIIIILTGFGIIKYDINKSRQYDSIYFCFLLFIAILIIGLRYKVGVDTYNYMDIYPTLPKISKFKFDNFTQYGYQPLFLLLCEFCKEVTSDFTFFQIIHATIVNTIIFFYLRKTLPKYKYIAVLLYLVTYYLYFNCEILKESLAVSFGLIAFYKYKQHKYIQFIIFCIVAFLFHLSAFILLLYPLFSLLKFNKKFILIFSLYMVGIWLIKPYMDQILPAGKILMKASAYISEADSGKLNINWVIVQILFYVVIPGIVSWIFKRKLTNEGYISYICTYMLLGVGVIWYQIIFTRFPNYFAIPLILAFSSILGYSITRKPGVRIWMVGVVTMYVIICNYNYLSHNGMARWFPYVSIFNPREIKERNYLYYEFN